MRRPQWRSLTKAEVVLLLGSSLSQNPPFRNPAEYRKAFCDILRDLEFLLTSSFNPHG